MNPRTKNVCGGQMSLFPGRSARIPQLGHYGQIILKSNQEAPNVDVLRDIENLRGSRGTLFEHSLVADTHSRTGSLSAESGQLRR